MSWRRLERGWGRAWAALALWCWLGLGQAWAAEPPPWHLAFVVDCSAGMSQSWLGSSRREILEPALQTELLSLPLRVRAGVWAVGDGPGQVRQLLSPRPALEFRDVTLVLPRLGGQADLAAGVAQALDWLKDHRPGAVLVVSGGDSRLAAGVLANPPLAADDFFCHALALGPEEASQKDLQEFALGGGGGYYAVARADQIGLALHGMVLGAISQASLLVLAHDKDNQPQALKYGLSRRDQLATLLGGRSGRPSQVLPGVYQLSWPAGASLGPAPAPAKVSVAVAGVTRLWAGGTGRLLIKALDPQGQELPWQASVSNLDSGKMEAHERRTPYEITLPAGVYRVRVLRPPLAWTVELGAGKQVDMVTGPQGSLTLALFGPSGPWRVPYHLEDRLSLRPAGTGYTGSPMFLLPSKYRLKAEVVPPWEHEFSLGSGQQLSLAMPQVGGILVRRDNSGLSQPFLVLDQNDRLLGSGISDRPLPVLPGAYRLRFPKQGLTQEVEVKAGHISALDAPRPPATH